MKAGVARSGKVSFVDPAKFTPHFSWKRRNGAASRGAELCCEGVSVWRVSEQIWDASVFVQQRGD